MIVAEKERRWTWAAIQARDSVASGDYWQSPLTTLATGSSSREMKVALELQRVRVGLYIV
jgi:hypothetical protein